MKSSDNINKYLDLICDKIKYKVVINDIRTELYGHILEKKENYVSSGLDDNEAEFRAIEDIGDSNKISNEFNNIYKRKLDWKLLIISIFLIGLNVLIFSTVFTKNNNNVNYIIMNTVYLIVGFVCSILFYYIDYIKIGNSYMRYRYFRAVF